MLLSLYLWVCVICMLAIWSSLQPEKEVPRHNIPSDDSSCGGGGLGARTKTEPPMYRN